MEGLHNEVVILKAERKKVEKHITFGQLPEDAKFERLAVSSKPDMAVSCQEKKVPRPSGFEG
jgi:hypothetical protein